MSSGIQNQAADRRGPEATLNVAPYTPKKCNFATTAASQNLDLSDAATGFGDLKYQDRYICMSVESGTFQWYWSNNSGDTIAAGATGNGSTVGAFAPSGIIQDERPTGRYLVIITSVASVLHIWTSSGPF